METIRENFCNEKERGKKNWKQIINEMLNFYYSKIFRKEYLQKSFETSNCFIAIRYSIIHQRKRSKILPASNVLYIYRLEEKREPIDDFIKSSSRRAAKRAETINVELFYRIITVEEALSCTVKLLV